MNRRRDPMLVAAIAVLGLTGCGVPDSGPATRLDKVEQDSGNGDSAEPVILEPSTKEITTVRNFLGAAAGDVSGRAKRLAKFFEPGDKQKWSQPSEGLQIVRIDPDGVNSADDGDSYSAEVTVTGVIVGVYGQNGQVKPWSGDEEFKQTFELTREGSREVWHLTEAPRQIYLSDDFFATGYRMSPLYFPASSDNRGTLVPDPRWLPKELIDSDARYNQLVDWLLGGPADKIRSTVSSEFPDGTSREKVVSSQDGQKFTVDISVDSAAQPAKDHKTMSAQLAWTLGLTDSETLTLSVDGQDRFTADVSDWSGRVRTPDEDTEADGLAYYVHEGAVASNDPAAEYAGTEAPGLRQAVIGPDGDRMAAVVGDGSQRLLVGPAGKLERVEKFSSSGLNDPQWLDHDTILVIDNGDPVTVDIDSGDRQKLSIEEGQGAPQNLCHICMHQSLLGAWREHNHALRSREPVQLATIGQWRQPDSRLFEKRPSPVVAVAGNPGRAGEDPAGHVLDVLVEDIVVRQCPLHRNERLAGIALIRDEAAPGRRAWSGWSKASANGGWSIRTTPAGPS